MSFKDRAVATIHEGLGAMPESDARDEATRTDLPVLEAERDRLRRRLDFWKKRHLELTTQSPPPPEPKDQPETARS